MTEDSSVKAISRFDSLHTMRGLAAIAVMFSHFSWTLNSAYDGLGTHLFKYGYLGVDIFFIISGFVISLSSDKVSSNFSGCLTFAKHRLKRLLPAYYFWLLVAFLTGGAMSIFHYPDKVNNLVSAVTFTPAIAANGPLYQSSDSLFPIRWSLTYEMLFYVAAAITVFFTKRTFILFFLILTSVFATPYFFGFTPTLSDAGVNSGYKFLNFISNPMMLLFLIGVALQKNVNHILSLPLYFRRIFGILLTVTSIICINNTENVTHSLTSGGFFMALLFVSVLMNDDLFKEKTPKVFIILGDISYSLYLIHILMNSALDSRLAKIGMQDGWIKFILFAGLSLLLAFASYRYIESPFLKKKP